MPASKFVAAVFLAVVFVGAPSSFGAAALTYRVAAGRTTSGTVGFSAKTATGTHDAPSMSFTDARTRTRVGCTVGRVHGSVTLGRTHTARIGTVTALSASRCTAFDGYVTLTPKGHGTWNLVGISRTAHGVTALSLRGVTVTVSSAACSFTVSGTTDGSYSNSTRRLTVKTRAGSGHSLRASRVSGCGGVIDNGDVIALVGTFGVSTHKGALKIS